MRKLGKLILLAGLVPLFAVQAAFCQLPGERVQPPDNYEFDGCSLFPDGDYGECCIAHDRDYFVGGTRAERKASDKRLRKCVRQKGHKYISVIMYYGVRIGGVAFLPTSFRWGFGQPKKK